MKTIWSYDACIKISLRTWSAPNEPLVHKTAAMSAKIGFKIAVCITIDIIRR